jgi:flagellar basal-body rod protein FlgG
MNGAFEIGKVALRSQQRALETTANNIANVNTPGFKRSEVIFSEVFADGVPAATQVEDLARADYAGSGGVRVDTRDAISAQGELKQTGEMLDIAIEGPGFIELLGPEGEVWLWRGGRLSVNRDGYLAGPQELALKALISIPDDATGIAIDRSGVVVAQTVDEGEVELGQITLVRVESQAGVERLDGGLFRVAGEAGAGTIAQGMVEESNVDFSEAMIELLMIQRAYAASAQIVQSADQLSSITNNLKRG